MPELLIRALWSDGVLEFWSIVKKEDGGIFSFKSITPAVPACLPVAWPLARPQESTPLLHYSNWDEAPKFDLSLLSS